MASIQEIFSSYETAKHFKMRNKYSRKAVRLSRMVQDELFFTPKVYGGTPRG